MKSGRDYAWWVEYIWEYEIFDPDDNMWVACCDYDSGRFDCVRKDIKKTVKKHIEEYELQNEDYRNLKVTITLYYLTTPEEI